MAHIHSLAQRPSYTYEQLEQYLVHLHRNVPNRKPLTLPRIHTEIKASPLKALTKLMRLHLSTIPWGNLAMHYSPHHTLPLRPPSYLFNKLVTRNFGGYCMEQNLLFSNVLRSLGYELYLTGARISHSVGDTRGKHPDGYGGFEHMLIFITIDHQKYLVDVGFGAGNALAPIPLNEGEEVPCQPGMVGRVVKRPLAASTQTPKEKWWVFQNKVIDKEDVGEQGWTNAYCFNEMEWFEEDFATSNHKTSTSPRSWFTYTFVITRMILEGEEAVGGGTEHMQVNGEVGTKEGEEGVEVLGSVTLFGGTLTRRSGGGQIEVLMECKSETERVEMLRKCFGIELREDEREGIRGMVTELK